VIAPWPRGVPLWPDTFLFGNRFRVVGRRREPARRLARVLATLKRVRLGAVIPNPPSTEIAATIDSDLAAPSSGWITVNAQHYSSCCCERFPFASISIAGMPFLDSAWFAEVQLITHDATGNPAVMAVAVLRDEP